MDKNPQDQDSWLFDRIGKATASRIGDITRRTLKDKPYSTYGEYLTELVLERLTGRMADHFMSEAMQRGIDMEAEAALAYQLAYGIPLEFSGFIDHPEIGMSGASPDRLAGDDGLVEIKCPGAKNHMDFIMTEKPPLNYYWQCIWQMACTGRKWCDLYFYNPDFPAHLQAKRVRIERDDAAVQQAENAVIEFLAEVSLRVSDLEALGTEKQEEAA